MVERILRALPTSPGGGGPLVAPFQFVVTGEDNLRVRTWCGDPPVGAPGATTLTLRMIDDTGETRVTESTQAPTSVSAPAETLITLGRGAVVNLAVRYASSLINAAAIYVTVDLVRGDNVAATTVVGQLLGGYVTNGKALSWPGSEIEPWTRGSGLQRRFDVAAVGAGVNPVYTIDACRAFRLLALTGTFATSAAAGTRFPTFRLGVNGFPTLNYMVLPLLITVGGSGSVEVNWAVGYGGQLTAVPPRYYGPLPQGVILPPGSVIQGATPGLLAGDQWSAVSLWGEEFVLPVL